MIVRKNDRQVFFPLLLCALFTCVPLTNTAYATTYYVATSGNDSHPGTNTQPFRTIQEGVRNIAAGDKLYIKSGTYAEQITSNVQTIPTGTSWGNAPLIAALPGNTVILRPNNGLEVINLARSYIRYVIFEGLILDAANKRHAISMTNGANHVRFRNVEAKNATFANINISPGSGGSIGFNEFIGVKSHNAGFAQPSGSYGFYITTNNNILDSCQIYNNSSYGIHIFHSIAPLPSQNIVRNSRVYGNGIKRTASAGILLAKGSGNRAYNNIVYENPHGIEIAHGASNTKVQQNTVYNNKLAGIYTGNFGSFGTVIQNNIVYSNGTPIQNQGSGTVQSHNLSSNPQFVNASAKNFHLNSSSPAIDAGVTISGINRDHDGTPRPQGNHFDIGAYEAKNSSGGNGSTGGDTGGDTGGSSSSSPPPPPSTGSGTTSSFKAAHSNKCIEISANSRSTKAKAVQSRCDGQANQQFQLTPVGSNIFQLKASHSGQCLEIAGASRTPGTLLQQNVCTSGNHQRFRISGSSSTLVAVHSGQCVDVAAGLTNDGAKIVQWTCHGGRNQLWTGAIGTSASPPPPPTSTGSGTTSSFKAAHSNKCIEISANSRSTKAKAVQSRCDGQANQQFQLTPVGSNIFQLKASHSGQCLEIAGASRTPGTLLQQNVCTSGNHQRFRISGSSSTLVAVHSGQCVDVAAGLTNDGAKIVQWTCHGGRNQLWTRSK